MTTHIYRTLLIMAALTCTLSAQAFSTHLVVHNPANQRYDNKPYVVPLHQLMGLAPSERWRVAVFVNGRQIASQLDDLDGDGVPDELSFLVSLDAGEHKTITLKTIPQRRHRTTDSLVYADLIFKPDKNTLLYVDSMSSTRDTLYHRMHHHGVAFESQQMAYRIYFDRKHTIDVYAKRTPQLELHESLWYPTDDQLAHGFGDDVLRVSGSVGVGSVKPWNGTKAIHFNDVARRTQRILARGPLRTVCEVEVNDWNNNGTLVNLRVRYILYAHHRDCIVEVRADHDIDNLVTGVQKVNGGREGLLTEASLVGCWGTDWPVNDTIKYHRETVGLGVACYPHDVIEPCQDNVNNLLRLHYTAGTVLRFYLTCVAMKENNPPANNADDFFNYLRNWQSLVLTE